MKTYRQKLQLLIIANAVLVLMIAAHFVFTAARRSQATATLDLYPETSSVTKIRFSGAQQLTLLSTAGTWLVEAGDALYPADAVRVNAFLEALRMVNRVDQVASSSKAWADLGLAGPDTITIELVGGAGELISSFLLGSYATGSNMVYLALPNGQAAWRVPASFASYAKGSASLWYDLRLFPALVPAQVQAVELRGFLQYPDGVEVSSDYRLQRLQGGWTLSNAPQVTIDNAKVEAMLRAWAGARGQMFVPPSGISAAPGAAPTATMTAYLGDGSSLSASLAASDQADQFVALLQPLGKQLRLASWAVRESFKALSDLVVP